jgi:hypothetical protein
MSPLTELIDPPSILDMSQSELESLISTIRERRNRVIKAEVLLTIALVLAGFYLFVPSLRNLPSGSTRSSTSLTLTLPGLRNLSVRLLQ